MIRRGAVATPAIQWCLQSSLLGRLLDGHISVPDCPDLIRSVRSQYVTIKEPAQQAALETPLNGRGSDTSPFDHDGS